MIVCEQSFSSVNWLSRGNDFRKLFHITELRKTMKTMNFSVNDDHDVRLTLNARQVASTREAKGLSIECVRGSIWSPLRTAALIMY